MNPAIGKPADHPAWKLARHLPHELVATLNDEEASALANLIAPAVMLLDDEDPMVRQDARYTIATLTAHLRARAALDARVGGTL